MATFAVRDDITLSTSVRAERNDYDAELGRQGYDTLGATLQWEWQPSPDLVTSVYYGYDRSQLDLANVRRRRPYPLDASLGGTTYPLDALWWADDEQRNHYLGATVDRRLARMRFEVAANYIESRGTTDFAFALHGLRSVGRIRSRCRT